MLPARAVRVDTLEVFRNIVGVADNSTPKFLTDPNSIELFFKHKLNRKDALKAKDEVNIMIL